MVYGKDWLGQRQDGCMLVLGQRDDKLVVRRLCRRHVHGGRRDVRVYASDRLLRLDDCGGRGLRRSRSALAGADGAAAPVADVEAVSKILEFKGKLRAFKTGAGLSEPGGRPGTTTGARPGKSSGE